MAASLERRITFYADRIKSEQERHNQEIGKRGLERKMKKAAKAKVILEFIPALSDPQDKMKPKIAAGIGKMKHKSPLAENAVREISLNMKRAVHRLNVR